MAAEAERQRDLFGLAGFLLDGRFQIESAVAEGGFGVLYVGYQTALDRKVAVKVLKTPPTFNEAARADFRERFATEAKLIARLNHPNIVKVYDFGVSQMPSGELAPWMALEWLDGETLEVALLRRRGQGGRAASEVAELFSPALHAFAHAHRQGIVHRDIKPANIMVVTRENEPSLHVLDFGISKVVSPDEIAMTGRTTTAIQAFSPLYAAPEQATMEKTGAWTDVHALGLILTEMLTDRLPYRYEGPEYGGLLPEIISPERPTPRLRGVDVGPWEPILQKAVALKGNDRYRNAGDLLSALRAALGLPSKVMTIPPNAVSIPPGTPPGTDPKSIPPGTKVTGDSVVITIPPTPGDDPSITKPKAGRTILGLVAGLVLVGCCAVAFLSFERSKADANSADAGTTIGGGSTPVPPNRTANSHPASDSACRDADSAESSACGDADSADSSSERSANRTPPTPSAPVEEGKKKRQGFAKTAGSKGRDSEDETPSGPSEADEKVAQVRSHYQRGKTFYDLQKYEQAIAEFQAAYELDNNPDFIFDVAQAYYQLGRASEAVRWFQTYIRLNPSSAEADTARKKIAELKAADEPPEPAAIKKKPIDYKGLGL